MHHGLTILLLLVMELDILLYPILCVKEKNHIKLI